MPTTSMTNDAAKMHLMTGLAAAVRQALSVRRESQCLCTASAIGSSSTVLATDADVLTMNLRMRGTLHGEIRLEVAEKDARRLLEDPEGLPRESLLRDWRELLDGVVQHLPKRAADAGMFAFSVEAHRISETSADGIQIGQLEISEAEDLDVMLHVLADDELVDSLQVAEWSAPSLTTQGGRKALRDPQLGRVIDVPLGVTLRFGQKSMRLREVLELTTGTLIELDRQVDEPVDLMLGERLIARGQVVIVEGNYGLRVTEIVERDPLRVL
jgi:flagellar motor switch protein FliN